MYAGPEYFDRLMGEHAPWAAELMEPEVDVPNRGLEIGHEVVIDGLDESGNLSIRDPKQGTAYEMQRHDFLHVWTGRAVLRK